MSSLARQDLDRALISYMLEGWALPARHSGAQCPQLLVTFTVSALPQGCWRPALDGSLHGWAPPSCPLPSAGWSPALT